MMKKIFNFLILFLCAQIIFGASLMKLDCSSQENMEKSLIDMLSNLDSKTQLELTAAMATIGVVLAENKELGGHAAMLKMLDNKTPQEIIAISRRLTPHIRQHQTIVDARTPQSFENSISKLLISLDSSEQAKFSEAIAKILYDAQQKKEPVENLHKRLDGKTAKEIIEIGKKLDNPFSLEDDDNLKNKEYILAPLSAQEIKERGLDTKKPQKKETKFAPSLSPDDNF